MTITTEQLINILSQPPQPRKPYGFFLAMGCITLASLALTLTVLGLRQDLGPALTWVTMLQKMLLLLSVFAVAFLSLRRVSRPVVTPAPLWQKVLLPAVFAGAFICDILFIPSVVMDTHFLLKRFLFCFACVSLYGLAGMYALVKLMRFYAPADTSKAGMVVGFAAAAASAIGYSVHCPVDHPLFILLAYGLPVAGLAWLGQKMLPKYINW
jgi:hypothetical protein